jgi:hypothetical protein
MIGNSVKRAAMPVLTNKIYFMRVTKNLLLIATIEKVLTGGLYQYEYNFNLWGQTPENPQITFITGGKHIGDYHTMINFAREKFCKYFEVSDSDITHLENFYNI